MRYNRLEPCSKGLKTIPCIMRLKKKRSIMREEDSRILFSLLFLRCKIWNLLCQKSFLAGIPVRLLKVVSTQFHFYSPPLKIPLEYRLALPLKFRKVYPKLKLRGHANTARVVRSSSHRIYTLAQLYQWNFLLGFLIPIHS